MDWVPPCRLSACIRAHAQLRRHQFQWGRVQGFRHWWNKDTYFMTRRWLRNKNTPPLRQLENRQLGHHFYGILPLRNQSMELEAAYPSRPLARGSHQQLSWWLHERLGVSLHPKTRTHTRGISPRLIRIPVVPLHGTVAHIWLHPARCIQLPVLAGEQANLNLNDGAEE